MDRKDAARRLMRSCESGCSFCGLAHFESHHSSTIHLQQCKPTVSPSPHGFFSGFARSSFSWRPQSHNQRFEYPSHVGVGITCFSSTLKGLSAECHHRRCGHQVVHRIAHKVFQGPTSLDALAQFAALQDELRCSSCSCTTSGQMEIHLRHCST